MGIVTIPNQPVRFKNIAIPEEVACMGQEFAQLVNKDDQMQFQLRSTNLVTNGDFTLDLTGWDVYLGITGVATLTNASDPDACDGEVVITPSNGTPAYTYSIDGGLNFQASATFTGLCVGDYIIMIKDSTGKQGTVEFSIDANIVCGTYTGSDTDDLLGLTTSQILNCLTSDFI